MSKKKEPCHVCGVNMYDKGKKEVCAGIIVELSENDYRHKEEQRIIETFGATEFQICFICLLKSLGVKPL